MIMRSLKKYSAHIWYRIREIQWATRLQDSWRKMRVSGTARRKELDRNIWYLYVEVFWAAIFMAVFGFNSTYALRLGASNTLMGYLSSIPSLLAMAVLVPAATLLERTSNRAPLMNWSLFIGRAMYFGLALAPWIAPQHAAAFVVTVLILRAAPMNIYSAGFNPMLADMIPPRDRAQVFANRNIISSATVAICSFIFGQFLDATVGLRWAEFPVNYQILLAVGGIGGVLSAYFVSRLKLPPSKVVAPRPERRTKRVRPSLKRVLADMRGLVTGNRGYMRILINTLVFNLGAWLVMPLYTIFFVNDLGASDGWIGLNSTLANIGVIVGQLLWKKIIDRKGDAKALLWSVPLAAIYAFLVAMFPNLTLILLFGVLINLINPGVNLSHFNVLVEQCPPDRRASYMAVFNTAMNAGAFVAPLAGVALSNIMDIRWVLVIGGIIRLGGAGMFYLWRVDSHAPTAATANITEAESVDVPEAEPEQLPEPQEYMSALVPSGENSASEQQIPSPQDSSLRESDAGEAAALAGRVKGECCNTKQIGKNNLRHQPTHAHQGTSTQPQDKVMLEQSDADQTVVEPDPINEHQAEAIEDNESAGAAPEYREEHNG